MMNILHYLMFCLCLINARYFFASDNQSQQIQSLQEQLQQQQVFTDRLLQDYAELCRQNEKAKQSLRAAQLLVVDMQRDIDIQGQQLRHLRNENEIFKEMIQEKDVEISSLHQLFQSRFIPADQK